MHWQSEFVEKSCLVEGDLRQVWDSAPGAGRSGGDSALASARKRWRSKDVERTTSHSSLTGGRPSTSSRTERLSERSEENDTVEEAGAGRKGPSPTRPAFGATVPTVRKPVAVCGKGQLVVRRAGTAERKEEATQPAPQTTALVPQSQPRTPSRELTREPAPRSPSQAPAGAPIPRTPPRELVRQPGESAVALLRRRREAGVGLAIRHDPEGVEGRASKTEKTTRFSRSHHRKPTPDGVSICLEERFHTQERKYTEERTAGGPEDDTKRVLTSTRSYSSHRTYTVQESGTSMTQRREIKSTTTSQGHH